MENVMIWVQDFYKEHNLSTWSLAPLAHVSPRTLQLYEEGRLDEIHNEKSIPKINKAICVVMHYDLIRPKWNYRGQYGDSIEYHREFSKELIKFNTEFKEHFEDPNFRWPHPTHLTIP